MTDLIKQVALFSLVYFVNRQFKYFFLLINITPLILFYFFNFAAEDLIGYFILETVVFCFINILCLKLIDLPTNFIKAALIIISLSLVVLSTFLIPSWNVDEPSTSRIAFWNYTAILFTFYTINFFTTLENFLDLDTQSLRKNVIYKFSILAFVAIASTVLSKYLKADIAFILILLLTKTILDLAVNRKLNTTVQNSNR